MKRVLAFLLAVFLFGSALAPICAEETDNGDTIVYVTASGTKYHRGSCSYLKSKYEITLREAAESGYTPCSRCSPPRYNGTLDTKNYLLERSDANSKNSSKSESSRKSSGSTTRSSPESATTRSQISMPGTTDIQTRKKDSGKKSFAASLGFGGWFLIIIFFFCGGLRLWVWLDDLHDKWKQRKKR